MNRNLFYLGLLVIGLASCNQKPQEQEAVVPDQTESVENVSILRKVDDLHQQLKLTIADFDRIATLDHHRMAQKEGVYTPPAIASIFSDSKVNTYLLSNSGPLVGLDLPFKTLCYSEADTINDLLTYTSSKFIAKRHGLSGELMSNYADKIYEVLSDFSTEIISETNIDEVNKGFGIINIQSDYDYFTTVQNLRDIVSAQSDTKWFGEIDYQKDAEKHGVNLNPTILLLFGGPAPGGKAMMTTPKIGLDAFCQKLLVYENTEGEVWIAFNDIVAFSNLYYGSSTEPQEMINQRLTATFTKAISEQEN